MTWIEIAGLVVGSGTFSAALLELLKWMIKRFDTADASKQQQSLAQIDDDAKMRSELWQEIEKLRTHIASNQARTEELTRLNGELSGKNMAQEAKIENFVQRLTAVTLERDMGIRRITELESKVDELETQVATLQGRRRKPLGGIA